MVGYKSKISFYESTKEATRPASCLHLAGVVNCPGHYGHPDFTGTAQPDATHQQNKEFRGADEPQACVYVATIVLYAVQQVQS